MLRRTLDDVTLDLPPLRIVLDYLPHTPEMAGLAAKAEHFAEEARLLGVEKAKALVPIIADELERNEYDKVVIMAQHHDTLAVLEEGLARFRVVRVDGTVTPARRGKRTDEFRDDFGARVFLGQQNATGTGLDGLQVASEIVMVEPPWSPNDVEQAVKRVHRVGSGRPVRARLMAVPGTQDERRLEALARKVRMAVGAGLEGR
jgi:SNF2 family DNA or RNA helicase